MKTVSTLPNHRLADTAAHLRWRTRNLRRYRLATGIRAGRLGALLTSLTRSGVARGTVEQLLGSRDLFYSVQREAQALHAAYVRDAPTADETKPYKAHLLTGVRDVHDPFLSLALHRDVLQIVNSYLRMRSFLRALDVWLTVPTPGPAVQTQLWHRDGDDFMNVKLFVHLTDVTRAAGPFCFAPRTHPRGDRRTPAPDDGTGRSSDEQMAEVVPEAEQIVCTGDAGTVVLADTCGYHKQLKPTGAERLLLMAQYTSPTPRWPRTFDVVGDLAGLDRDQRYALQGSRRS